MCARALNHARRPSLRQLRRKSLTRPHFSKTQVDDLEEIGKLDMYIKQTQSVLIFLSKGYFFSVNCKKEVAATLDNGNPIMLLHETDPARGGAPIEQLQADCPDNWRSDIFVPYRPIIPWLRVKDFKVISLKMIVSSMLQHQSKLYQRLQGPAIKGSDNVEEDCTGPPKSGPPPKSGRLQGRPATDVDMAPKRKASDFKGPDLNSLGADLNSLGADLFMLGEVTRQQLVFPTKTTLIVSAENPGAGRLAQETTIPSCS